MIPAHPDSPGLKRKLRESATEGPDVQASRRDRPRPLPVLRGVLPVRRSMVAGDVTAGLTLAALGIPEVLGYARIAGMPVATGLYTLLLPMAAFAVLGSSRHLVVGADSATAAILAAALTGLAAAGSMKLATCWSALTKSACTRAIRSIFPAAAWWTGARCSA